MNLNKAKGLLIFIAASLAAAVFGAEPATPPSIDGTYQGVMDFDQGPAKEVPLSVSLTLTGETQIVEISPGVSEVEQIIDANFLVDSEGGPFAFSKVTYRLSASEIDMRYNRTMGVTVGQPPSFRLVGNLDGAGTITGNVLASFGGKLGTFQLVKKGSGPLVSHVEYEGVWAGAVKILPEGDLYHFGITIAPTGFANLNPPQLPFDYTLGKIAHLDFDGTEIPLRAVAIDYLRRQVLMSDKDWSDATAAIAVQATLDTSTGNLTGYFSSLYAGKRGQFTISRIR